VLHITKGLGFTADSSLRQADLAGVVAEAALKILIHYGNIERPDKLLKL